MADVTERMLRLLATLQAGHEFTGEDLSIRLEISPRTLRRDVERLRGYGYPVHTRPGPGGSYQLAAGQRMPPLVFDDDEAVATIIGLATLATTTASSAAANIAAQPGGLRAAADRAYGKIDGLLPARLRPQAAALRASIEAERRPTPDVAVNALGDLADAIAARHIVVFDYVDAQGTISRRRIEPQRHVHIDGRWYVFGWDLDRDDWRVFRTDRVAELRSTARPFAPRALPADSAIAYLRSGMGDAGA